MKSNFKANIKKKKASFTLQERLITSGDKQVALGQMPMIKRVSELSKFIRIVTLNSRFDNVIDLHYLLTQIHKIETEFLPQIRGEVSSFIDQSVDY
jgi:DNA polymerase II large subunit